MTPLHRLCNPAPLRADIAHPGPGLYWLLRAAAAPGGWIVVVDTAQTRRRQIGGR
jgi:hypothetical protein